MARIDTSLCNSSTILTDVIIDTCHNWKTSLRERTSEVDMSLSIASRVGRAGEGVWGGRGCVHMFWISWSVASISSCSTLLFSRSATRSSVRSDAAEVSHTTLQTIRAFSISVAIYLFYVKSIVSATVKSKILE